MVCHQVVDAKKASYGVENATYAVVQLAQTTMRSELGKITLDKTFEERATLNLNIVESIRFVSHWASCMVPPNMIFAASLFGPAWPRQAMWDEQYKP